WRSSAANDSGWIENTMSPAEKLMPTAGRSRPPPRRHSCQDLADFLRRGVALVAPGAHVQTHQLHGGVAQARARRATATQMHAGLDASLRTPGAEHGDAFDGMRL